MTTDRDPVLQSLFVAAQQEMAGDAFTERLMSRIGKLRRRTLSAWIGVGFVVAVAAWLLTGPVVSAVNLGAQFLPKSLIELDNQVLADVVAPVNSVAILVAVGILGLRAIYRKIFS